MSSDIAKTASEASAQPAGPVAEALDNLRAVVARERGRKGRDHIRRMPFGLMLDAMDAGKEQLFSTDNSEAMACGRDLRAMRARADAAEREWGIANARLVMEGAERDAESVTS